LKLEARVMDVTSTLEGEKIGMSIDDAALAHIMSVLTDLYSDPELAVIREYSTNALDAHIVAGVTRPIEVTLPTSLSPYLKIKDFGEGLDIEDIRNIYSRYGTSTKRATNDLVGTLGLGCKSALTYTNQFTLQGIKDGIATQVSISRDEDGAGSMTIVAEYETDDENGVEITIPVKARNDFEQKANHFFQFWTEGTVLVNGEQPTRITGIEITDDILCVEKDDLDQNYIVMGNVAYPFETGDDYRSNFRTVAFVEIGAVQFTPSRESLQLTASTKAVIEDIKERVAQGKEAAVLKMINEATSKPEALRISMSASRLFGTKGKLTYNGVEIPSEFDSEGVQEHPFMVVNRFRTRYQKAKNLEQRLPIAVSTKAIFFTGFSNKTFSPTNHQKLELWWEATKDQHEGMEVDRFILVETLPNRSWVDKARIFKYEDVAAIKITRDNSKRQDGRPTGSYKGYVAGVYGQAIQGEDIDTSNPIYYYDGRDGYYTKWANIVNEANPNCTLVELSANRVVKFVRMFPTAVTLKDGARAVAQKWADKLTRDQIIALNMESSQRTALKKLDASRVNDPAVVKAIALASQDHTRILTLLHDKYEYLCTVPEVKVEDPRVKYPLLSPSLDSMRFSGNTTKIMDHLYIYLNSAYDAALNTPVAVPVAA
jgi:hypothetical protein